MIIETERLILRRWETGDAQSLFEYASDPLVGPPAGWPPHGSLDESRRVIDEVLCKPETWAICLKTDGRAIGAISLKLKGMTDLTDRDDECELGYWLGRPFWGRGIMPEAVRAVLRRAFVGLGMSRVWCGYYDGNLKSKRVQEKCGFRYQWTTEEVDVPLMQEKRRGHVSCLTREEWRGLDGGETPVIEVRIIDSEHRRDINIPNRPFALFGRMVPGLADGRWSFTAERYAAEDISEMCFPDENYDYDAMAGNSLFLGAYEGERCVGLAILQRGLFRYAYLYDLKVDRGFRRQGVGALLLEEAKAAARREGLRGIYTIGQDDNLGACLFYLKNGFRIGGLDTEVYGGTAQEGKADIFFYLDV